MIINVKVMPGAKKQDIKSESGNLTIHLKSKPVKGKANQELIDLLSSHFNVPKTSIAIIKGAHSKNKLVEID